MKRGLQTVWLAAAAAMMSGSAQAHHGATSVYDISQQLTISGTVTGFRFVDPHVLLFVEIRNDDGTSTVWSAGLTSSSALARGNGWTEATLQPGDSVTITGSPASSGAASLLVETVRDGNGNSIL